MCLFLVLDDTKCWNNGPIYRHARDHSNSHNGSPKGAISDDLATEKPSLTETFSNSRDGSVKDTLLTEITATFDE